MILVEIFIGVVLTLVVIFHIFWFSAWMKAMVEPRPNRYWSYEEYRREHHHGDYPYLDK